MTSCITEPQSLGDWTGMHISWLENSSYSCFCTPTILPEFLHSTWWETNVYRRNRRAYASLL